MKFSFKMEMSSEEPMVSEFEEKARELLFLIMVKMEQLAKEKAPANIGELKRRIHINPPGEGEDMYVLSDGVSYGVHVEYGTSPHVVPIEPLKFWARRVLGDEELGYAVRAKIAKEGTNAQPYMRPAYTETMKKWYPRIAQQVFL